jgi:3-isopropylmalate/(R)-2-methylmalate dehydratase small subunit
VADDAGFRRSFTVDPFRRQCLLEGLDDIGLTLRQVDAIGTWERAHGLPPVAG